MKERPILFSGPLVRAILEGRKTETRRLLPATFNGICGERLVKRTYPPGRWGLSGKIQWEWGLEFHGTYPTALTCPYGRRGDRLWVRETWAAHWMYDDVPPREARSGRPDDSLWYRADGDDATAQRGTRAEGRRGRWRPSIHMPRWASRLTLRLTEAPRIERVQAITENGARAEGVEPTLVGHRWHYREAFAELWDRINARRGYGWDVDPWVWVLRFEVVPAAGAEHG